MNKQSGNVLLWLVLGVVAIGLGVLIVWRYFAATDALENAQQTDTAAVQPLSGKGVEGVVDIKEYGLKLSYDNSSGEVSYKIVTQDYGNGVSVKAAELSNLALTNKKNGCSGEFDPNYGQLGAISIQKQLDKGEFAPTEYIKSGDNYLVYNYLKMNMAISEPCYDKTLDEKSTAQKMDLYNSFKPKATKNE